MPAPPNRPSLASLPAVVPVAAAVGVFGVAYGAAAEPILGPWLALASSVVVFSGAAQFSMVGLLAAGAAPLAVLWAVVVLNLRHLAFGALLRPRLTGVAPARRARAAWFLVDESFGLALVAPERAATVLLRTGAACYGAWVTGTAVGVAGAALPALEPMASAVFPVLFIGLAATTAAGHGTAVRAAVAAGLVAVLLALWPGLGGFAPLLAAVAVALPGREPPQSRREVAGPARSHGPARPGPDPADGNRA